MTRRSISAAGAAAFLLTALGASPLAAEPVSAENLKEVVIFGEARVPRWMVATIRRASRAVGVDATYMLALADKESSFHYRAKAPTSSAVGLYQFLEGTWLEVLKQHAAKHGFDAAADAITIVGGRPTVADPQTKRWLLGLRADPYLSALMAAEMVQDSRARLAKQTGRSLTKGDLYLAHFLGNGGASRMLKLVDETPERSAAVAFPAAAKANRSIFASSRGKQRHATVAEVHARIGTMMRTRAARYTSLAPLP
jgi:hypothetical protein